MESAHLDSHAWLRGRPLCCRYLLVHFAALPMQVRAGAAASGSPIVWALGAMSDGQPEVLGVWQHPVKGALDWQAVFADLAIRGVVRIRYVDHVDAAAAQATFPEVTVLSSPWPELSGLPTAAGKGPPVWTRANGAVKRRRGDANEPPRGVEQLARRLDRASQLLQRDLSKAATRRGPIETGAAAAAFVEAWLESAERRERKRQLAAERRAAVAAAARLR